MIYGASTPWHLLTKLASVFVPNVTQAATGEPRWNGASGLTYEVACSPVQVTSSNEAVLFSRDMLKTMFDLFLAPVTTSGTAYEVLSIAKVTVDGVTYDVVGGVEDQAGLGVVYRVRLERDS